jgi:hypothetical protein
LISAVDKMNMNVKLLNLFCTQFCVPYAWCTHMYVERRFSLKISIFCDVIPYSLEVFYWCFGTLHYATCHSIPEENLFTTIRTPNFIRFSTNCDNFRINTPLPKKKEKQTWWGALSSQRTITIRRMLSFIVFDCLQVFVLANPRHYVPAGPTRYQQWSKTWSSARYHFGRS